MQKCVNRILPTLLITVLLFYISLDVYGAEIFNDGISSEDLLGVNTVHTYDISYKWGDSFSFPAVWNPDTYRYEISKSEEQIISITYDPTGLEQIELGLTFALEDGFAAETRLLTAERYEDDNNFTFSGKEVTGEVEIGVTIVSNGEKTLPTEAIDIGVIALGVKEVDSDSHLKKEQEHNERILYNEEKESYETELETEIESYETEIQIEKVLDTDEEIENIFDSEENSGKEGNEVQT